MYETFEAWLPHISGPSLSNRSNRVEAELPPNSVKSFITGAFVFGGVTGSHSNFEQYPPHLRCSYSNPVCKVFIHHSEHELPYSYP